MWGRKICPPPQNSWMTGSSCPIGAKQFRSSFLNGRIAIPTMAKTQPTDIRKTYHQGKALNLLTLTSWPLQGILRSLSLCSNQIHQVFSTKRIFHKFNTLALLWKTKSLKPTSTSLKINSLPWALHCKESNKDLSCFFPPFFTPKAMEKEGRN